MSWPGACVLAGSCVICNRHPSDLGPGSQIRRIYRGHVAEFRSVESLNALPGEFPFGKLVRPAETIGNAGAMFSSTGWCRALVFASCGKYERKLHRLQANSKFRSKLAAVHNSERASCVRPTVKVSSPTALPNVTQNFPPGGGSRDAL
jgi:hypothetical protein